MLDIVIKWGSVIRKWAAFCITKRGKWYYKQVLQNGTNFITKCGKVLQSGAIITK